MKSSSKTKKQTPKVTVGDFYTNHANVLNLKLLAGAGGLKTPIREGSVHRPGLALAGFYRSFAHNRVQIIGRGETDYLRSLPEAESRKRLRKLFAYGIPCVLFARNLRPPRVVIEEAEEHDTPVFQSSLHTMRLVNAATICLELDFAPFVSEHGSMVDVHGIGILIKGSSGVGKSECVLSLVERGHSLVADDVVRIRLIEGRELIATAADLSRFHMEVRGLGIINAAQIFGIRSIRFEKRIDLVVTLKEWKEGDEVERVGVQRHFYEILQTKVPHVTIPVRPGRDLASLVEVAAMDQKLKDLGQNSALEFNERLLKSLRQH